MLLSTFDCLRRAPRNISKGSLSGAVVSVVTTVAMLGILCSQFSMWCTPEYKRRVVVKRLSHDDYIPITIDITFLKAKCTQLQFKLHDSFTSNQIKLTHHLNMVPSGDGCQIHSDFYVKKANGQFMFVGKDTSVKLDHTITDLRFGHEHPFIQKIPSYTALNGARLHGIGNSSHNYVVKLLHTTITDKIEETEDHFPYQYTFSYRPFKVRKIKDYKPKHHLIIFKYNWSPLSVEYITEYRTLYTALTNTIAYCGGLFTSVEVLHRAFIGGRTIIKDTFGKKL